MSTGVSNLQQEAALVVNKLELSSRVCALVLGQEAEVVETTQLAPLVLGTDRVHHHHTHRTALVKVIVPTLLQGQVLKGQVVNCTTSNVSRGFDSGRGRDNRGRGVIVDGAEFLSDVMEGIIGILAVEDREGALVAECLVVLAILGGCADGIIFHCADDIAGWEQGGRTLLGNGCLGGFGFTSFVGDDGEQVVGVLAIED